MLTAGLSVLSAAYLVVGCADDQARAQLADTNTRLSQLQQTVGVINTKVSAQRMVDILNQLDDLQNQINELNGSVDTLRQDQKSYKITQDQLYQSLQQQIQNYPQKAAASIPAATANTSGTNTGNDDDLKQALRKLKVRNFPQAIQELKSIIANSESSDTVALATYYLSVAYAANSQYKESIATARKFIGAYPNNIRIPDAMWAMYISQSQLGMKKSATNTARQLLKKYPNSNAAKRVQEDIEQKH